MTCIRTVGLAVLATLPTFPAWAGCTLPATDPQACLTGTIVSSDYRAALVEQAGSQDVERVRPGDALLDWTVAEIGPGYVVLNRDARRVRLGLAEAPAGSPKQGPMVRARLSVDRGG